ncbi:MAG TPA: F0F1 ATP synthase subunit delta [Gammaproteobacteria bacterium]|nr:F0F1 ATP synthase subunit delta [Gammaproteobacteria bacterium]
MAETITLARPYAKAVFEIASEHAALESWDKTLGLLAALSRDHSVQVMLGDSLIPSAVYAEVLIELAAKAGAKLDQPARNFVKLLAEYHRLGILPEIAADYAALRAEAEGTVEVDVRASTELDAAEQARISVALQKKLGRKVKLNCVTDKSLIGGAIIRAGDLVIDGSVRDKLGRLAATMIQ